MAGPELRRHAGIKPEVLTTLVVGVFAVGVGLGAAAFFYAEFSSLLRSVDDPELRAALRAMQLGLVAIWVGGALFGALFVRDAIERSQMRGISERNAATLERIERLLNDDDREKHEIAQKNRSFWSWRRAEVDKLDDGAIT